MNEVSYWNHIEQDYDTVNIYDGPKRFLKDFRKIPEYRGHLLASHWFLSELANGGLAQFFANSTGVLAPEAITGLKHIGLDKVSDALSEACKIFGNDYPREEKKRNKILKKNLGIDFDDDDFDDESTPFQVFEKLIYDSCEDDIDRFWDVLDTYAQNNS